ncbi:MAG TPA: HAD family phosphatase [Sphingomicrobium sp.]|nr:HAD family phosphatase [Sphingomicrobium sp.]
MTNIDAIIFDFDGVLLESEFEGNKLLAELLTDLGHHTSTEDAIRNFVGFSGPQFIEAIEKWVGGPLPPDFHERRREQSVRALQEGVRAVVGAVDFVQSLPPQLPIAVASSSTTRWLNGHLAHLGLAERFGDHVYSGREHVQRGKPEPDLYLFAAEQLGVDIERSVILEDSDVGVRGALASGATVIGLAAGKHILDDHAEQLRALGVEHIADSFDEVKRLIGLA